jgi:hypothetical protein
VLQIANRNFNMANGETRRTEERQPIEIIRELNRWWATRDFEKVRFSARARETRELLEIPAVQLFKLRNGPICMYGVYANRDHALAAIRAD